MALENRSRRDKFQAEAAIAVCVSVSISVTVSCVYSYFYSTLTKESLWQNSTARRNSAASVFARSKPDGALQRAPALTCRLRALRSD